LEDLKGFQSGGDSFCYLNLSVQPAMSDAASLWVVHQGRFPLYGVRILIRDAADPLPKSLDDVLAATKQFQVSELKSEAVLLAQAWPLPPSGSLTYTVQIAARNGWLLQALRMRKVAGVWRAHTVVFREQPDGKRAVLVRKTDEGFPSDATIPD
jgi:hypothetical protein